MKLKTLTFAMLSLAFSAVSFSAQAQDKKREPNPEKMLERMDTDKNGTISLEEFKSVKRKKEVDAKTLEKNFAKIDADSNGQITLEELKKQPKKDKKKD
ncbi:EF-hand domain-containing protein [Formosa sp. 3Alg 14/1]|uniref:EF-hand domain-containing protein n=1 Tax=Formosa sp. 3Alg 14/1 TaxID=3382190 RepID=UPI0039BEC373